MSHVPLHDDARRELQPLLSALCDGTLDDAGFARLHTLLESDASARRYYQHYLDLHFELADDAAAETIIEAEPIPVAKLAPASESPSTSAPLRRSTWRRYAAAAVLLLVAGVTGALLWFDAAPDRDVTTAQQAADQQQVATLTDTRSAQWEPDAGHDLLDLGAPVEPGRLRLRSGSAELLMRSTAVVTLLGRTDVEVLGPNRCRLHRGRLVANVPGAAHGFVVETPTHTVVDLGTRFIVEVDAGLDTRVDVLEGRVDVRPIDARPSAATEIGAGQAYRFTDGAAPPTRLVANASTFESAPPNTGAKLRVGQRDNNWRIIGPDGEQVVAEATNVLPDMKYLRGGNDSSWWITLPDSRDVKGDTIWTFETRLRVDRADAAELGLRGRFSVDNEVTAIRVNGRPVPVTPNGQRYQHNAWTPFVIDAGVLKQGENVVRFEVYNASSAPTSPVALRIEWSFESNP